MNTVKETANRLRVSESTIYALIRSGQLRSHRVGLGRGVIRISDAAIEEYLGTTASEPIAPATVRRTRPQLKHIRLS